MTRKGLLNYSKNVLKQVGLDPETGKVDIDKVEGRTPKSDRDRIRAVIDIIKELAEEYGGKAPMNIIATEMSDRYNMSEEKVEDLVMKLKRQGIIFEPERGYYKVV